MKTNTGRKEDRRVEIVSKKKNNNNKTKLQIEASSAQSTPDINEDNTSVNRAKLAVDFVEKLKSTTDIPIRQLTLDDPERCPVRFISGMMNSEPCAPNSDEVTKEYRDELHGGTIVDIDNEFSNRTNSEIYYISGDNKVADGDFQGAFEDISEAIRLDPKNYHCYGLRGVANYEMGRYKEAIEDETIYIDKSPKPETLYNRAESYYKTGKDEEALNDLNHALELISEMPNDYFLIVEINKLINIIKDKSLNREDYYQAPIGWEDKGKKSQTDEPGKETYDDVGPEIIRFVYKSMRIDAEWSIVGRRGFAWWGHHLNQYIWAEKCRRGLGVDVTVVNAPTNFLRNVEDCQQTYETINALNKEASQYALIYYPEKRSIKLQTSVYIHRQNLDWTKRLFLRAAGIQVSYAHRMVESYRKLFRGSEPDASPHPYNSFRQKEDEIISAIDKFPTLMNEKDFPLNSNTFNLMEFSLEHLFMVSKGDDLFTAEFPFSGNEPAAVRIAQGRQDVVTSLFLVNSDVVHPLLGRGLLMRMILPVSYGRERNLMAAATLNRLETRKWAKCHLNGAWCVDDKSNLLFVSFLPISPSMSGELANLAFSFARRSVWACEVLAEGVEDNFRRTNKMMH